MKIPIIDTTAADAEADKAVDPTRVDHLSNAILGLIRVYYIGDSRPRPEKPLEVLNSLAAAAAIIIHGCESSNDPRAERFFDRALEVNLAYWRTKDAEEEKPEGS